MVVLLLVLAATLGAEPVQLGFVINDNVPVYTDSSTQSAVLETLGLTDYRYVYGDTTSDGYNYNYNGWAKIVMTDSTMGWIGYENLLVTRYMYYDVKLDEPLYSEPDTSTLSYYVEPWDMQIRILEIQEKENETWLKVSFWGKMLWYKVLSDSLSFNVWGNYYSIFSILKNNGYYEDKSAFYENDGLEKDLDKAERFVLKLKDTLDQYQNIKLLPIYEDITSKQANGVGALCNYMLANLYEYSHRWNDLIDVLTETVTKYPHQWLLYCHAGASEYLRMANLYRDELNDTTKALDLYHTVIKEYHDELMAGDEWNDYADLHAAESIYDIIVQRDPGFISLHESKIRNETRNPAVALVAYKALILIYASLDNYTGMSAIASSMLEYYPDEKKGVYLNTRNISAELAAKVFTILRENCQYDSYNYFAERIMKNCFGYPLASYCAFKKAELADYTQPDNDYIINLYLAAFDSFPKYSFRNSDEFINYTSGASKTRYNTLLLEVATQATILDNNTPLYKTRLDTVNVIRYLPGGTQVRMLATDMHMIDYHHVSAYIKSPQYAKVQLQDSTIGWVQYDALESDKTLGEIRADNNKSWTMYKGDSGNNLYFTGPEITDPVIGGNLYAGSVRGLRFYDVNKDNVLDYLFVNNYTVQVIDGKTNELIDQYDAYGASDYIVVTDDRLVTHNIGNNRTILFKCYDLEQRKTLWQVEGGQYYNPVCHNGKLFCSSPDSGIQCINMVDGSVLWKTGIEYHYPTALAANEKAVIVSDQRYVLALNPETGEQLWYRDLGKYIDRQVPVLDQDRLYYMITRNTFAALEITTGEVIWQFCYTNDSYFNLQPIITPKYVVYSPYKDNITVLDKRTGKKVWQNIFDQLLKSYCVGGNTIYAQFERDYDDYSKDPTIYAFNLFTGNEVWGRYYPNDNPIVYQGGKLFLSGESGLVVVEDKLDGEQIGLDDFILYPNYPNPFNSGTVIQYALLKDSQVSVDIYNVLGQKITTLVNEYQQAGVHRTFWNGTDNRGLHAGNGIYFYRVRTGNGSGAKCMTLLK